MLEYLKLFYYLFNRNTIFLRRMSHGVGDNLLMSMLLPELKIKYPGVPIIVETELPDLFKYNPYVTWVTNKHFKTTRRHIRAKYKIDETTTMSIYEQMMKTISVKEKSAPQLFLSDEEKNWSQNKFPGNYIAICPTGKQTFTANRKEWGIDNFQKLRDLFNKYEFVQIGTKNDPLLENVIDARNLPIRKSASVIFNSIFFIGLEGGLMHLSKAVDKTAVIIYGGFVKPEISGYDDFINVYNETDCSPCFHADRAHSFCETMICMKEISPGFIFNLIINKGLTKNEN